MERGYLVARCLPFGAFKTRPKAKSLEWVLALDSQSTCPDTPPQSQTP